MEGSQRLAVAALAAIVASGCTMVGASEVERALPPVPRATPAGVSAAAPAERRAPIAGIRSTVAEPPSRGGNMARYEQSGRSYDVLDTSRGYDERGVASWYGEAFHGRPTSSGEPFDMYQLSAAHRTLPLPSWVEVTNLANGRRLLVRVNDRGPFHDPGRRILDLSYAAAVELGIDKTGTAPVRVRAIEPYQELTR